MSLRIAFDLDGVLADLDGTLAGIADRLFGQPPRDAGRRADPAAASPAPPGRPPSGDTAPAPAPEDEWAGRPRLGLLTRSQRRAIWDAVRGTENFWETLDEIEPGALARLSQTAVERGWEVIFLTQRPQTAGDTTQRQAQRWLAAHGFEWPSVIVVSGSRGKVADALAVDVVVDDRVENCLDVRNRSTARAILVCASDNPALPSHAARLGMEIVAGIGPCLDVLATLPADRPTLLDRVRKLIAR